MKLIADVFPKLQIQKDLVRSMPKKSHFKESFEKQHGNSPQIVEMSRTATLLYSLITVKGIDF